MRAEGDVFFKNLLILKKGVSLRWLFSFRLAFGNKGSNSF